MELSGLYVDPAGHLRPPTEPPVHNLKSPNTNIHIVMKRGVGFQINRRRGFSRQGLQYI